MDQTQHVSSVKQLSQGFCTPNKTQVLCEFGVTDEIKTQPFWAGQLGVLCCFSWCDSKLSHLLELTVSVIFRMFISRPSIKIDQSHPFKNRCTSKSFFFFKKTAFVLMAWVEFIFCRTSASGNGNWLKSERLGSFLKEETKREKGEPAY